MRLDLYLVERGYAESRTKAQYLISRESVTVDGRVVTKASFDVDGKVVSVIGDGLKYVSRGALKLEAAVKLFAIDPSGCKCVDIGSSTGGFTDCLLQCGAEKVFCVDSGTDQLHDSLRSDPRVTLREQFNARDLTRADVGYEADLVVMDVSFISQTVLYKNVRDILAYNGVFISLIKPQFEAGKDHIGKGGIVKNKKVHVRVIEKIIECAKEHGLFITDLAVSPIKGGDGNTEYLACFSKDISKGSVIDTYVIVSENQ